MWLEAAGLKAEQFIEVVKNSIIDGQVADWVNKNAHRSDADKAAHRQQVLNHGRQSEELRARLQWRKEQTGMAHRDDIQTFVDFIDADEHRI
jgi:hypothetical protein